MPYIDSRGRDSLDPLIEPFSCEFRKIGDLVYVFTRLALLYAKQHGSNFDTFCAIEGAFGTAAKEWYRRITSYYEDAKRNDNGDVY